MLPLHGQHQQVHYVIPSYALYPLFYPELSWPRVLSFYKLLFLTGYRFSLSLSSSCIRARSLSSNWKSDAVPHASISVNINQTFDIILNLSSEISLNNIFRLQKSVNPRDLISS